MNALSWIVFGALAGWVASLLAGTNERQGCLMNILVGVAGALVGGFVMELSTGEGFSFGWTWRSFLVAVLGAVLLLAVTGVAGLGRRRR
jgi:uncharacterized membrane protein YeaQ/YmgE (transglycosylase-associated protein family)